MDLKEKDIKRLLQIAATIVASILASVFVAWFLGKSDASTGNAFPLVWPVAVLIFINLIFFINYIWSNLRSSTPLSFKRVFWYMLRFIILGAVFLFLLSIRDS